MLLFLIFTLAVASAAPSQEQFRRASISGGNCNRWVPVTREQCPMAYSLAHGGSIESPYYNICNDDALGKASVDVVVPMYIGTESGEEITCRNAHACVGCPAFAPLLTSCPLLGSEGESLGATRSKASGSASAKRKRRSAGVCDCEEVWEECSSWCLTDGCRLDCEEARDYCLEVCPIPGSAKRKRRSAGCVEVCEEIWEECSSWCQTEGCRLDCEEAREYCLEFC